MKRENYRYRNLPIPGGGYVTGFGFHPKDDTVRYVRTDIGGAYRFDCDTQTFHSLIDHVTMEDLRETFPIALALDEKEPGRLYIAGGIWEKPPGKLAVSHDFGQHFTYYDMPMRVHGNLGGRGTGKRLIVDGKDSSRLYFASQADGLWMAEDYGKHWKKLPGMPENYLTFVCQTKAGALIVGSAGVTTKRSNTLRGYSLYVSYDEGESFETLWQPKDGEIEGVKLAGLVPQRYAMDENYLYVTFSVMGKNAYIYEHGYSCDGGSVICGTLVRYPVSEDGRIGDGTVITPMDALVPVAAGTGEDYLPYGFSGIAVSDACPGLVVTSTICRGEGDAIFRSFDYGMTWECILYDLSVGVMDFRTSYMTPKYNGGHNLMHWLTDLSFVAGNANELWFNTGTGVFRTCNLLDKEVHFSDWSDGIEETVHLNLYSPPKGEVHLIDILGDLGGFAFTSLDTPCETSFSDEEGNRYITCINADYSDQNPDMVVVTPRGNWTGRTKGGLIVSKDQCKTFERLPMPYGLSPKLDEFLHRIETPNVNSGWVSLSPDTNTILWNVADGICLPAELAIVSQDGGKTFTQVTVYDKDNELLTGEGFKVFSDRMDNELFYGFGEHSEFYLSQDGGKTFYERELPKEFPKMNFTLIDCANKTEVRGECGKQGVFYLAMKENGLWKLSYDKESDELRVKRLGKEGDIFYRMGLGVKRPGGDYATEDKAIYVAAAIEGVYGFYRSTDDGASFVCLNTDRQMFGEINSMEGDSQSYGRFYIATGSRGVLYGEPVGQEE